MEKPLVTLCIIILSLGALGSYILYEDPDYFIGFELNVEGDEGIESIDGVGHYCTDDYVELYANLKPGYIFDGWYDENGKLLCDTAYYDFLAFNAPIYAKTIRGSTLDLLRMDGIMTTTSRTVPLGEPCTLSVEESGCRFLGWYTPEGDLVSTSKEYTFTPTADVSLIAKSDSTWFEGSERLEWKLSGNYSDDVTVTLKDRYSRYFIDSYAGVTSGTADLIPGSYEIVAEGTLKDGTHSTETKTYEIKGDITRRYCWMFGDSPEHIEWTVKYSEYSKFRDSDIDRSPAEEDRLDFTDYTSDGIRSLAGILMEKTARMTDLECADYVLKLVQRCTEYQDDKKMYGQSEYWKFPLETIVERGGDCEDTSILFCSIMKAMGFETALLVYEPWMYDEGHMAGSVALDRGEGYYYTKNGLKFYYCETTSDNLYVGDDGGTDEYDEATVLVLGETDKTLQ